MATHYKIKTVDGTFVHADGIITDHTLCGLTLGGDSFLKIGVEIQTNNRINCTDCLKIIRYCKSIKHTELKK